MELSWTSFLLEIINFLVLVWILTHFLYQPVLKLVEQRRLAVNRIREEAEQLTTEATSLQRQYEARLQHWEQEKGQARVQMRRDLEQEHQRLRLVQQRALQEEREKFQVLLQRETRDNRRVVEQEALDLGRHICSLLLTRLSGPELENRLIRMLLEDLKQTAPERLEEMRTACKQGELSVDVVSAYPLDQAASGSLQQELSAALELGPDCRWCFRQEKALIAGVRIALGSWMLRANLLDELQYFYPDGADAGRS